MLRCPDRGTQITLQFSPLPLPNNADWTAPLILYFGNIFLSNNPFMANKFLQGKFTFWAQPDFFFHVCLLSNVFFFWCFEAFYNLQNGPTLFSLSVLGRVKTGTH